MATATKKSEQNRRRHRDIVNARFRFVVMEYGLPRKPRFYLKAPRHVNGNRYAVFTIQEIADPNVAVGIDDAGPG
jgi:hypothetical protein